jgi:hypothetical protein
MPSALCFQSLSDFALRLTSLPLHLFPFPPHTYHSPFSVFPYSLKPTASGLFRLFPFCRLLFRLPDYRTVARVTVFLRFYISPFLHPPSHASDLHGVCSVRRFVLACVAHPTLFEFSSLKIKCFFNCANLTRFLNMRDSGNENLLSGKRPLLTWD